MRTDDLLSLAQKLSPHSARLRAFLGVLAWNVHRTRMPGDAFSRLPQLVEEVMAEIGVNELGEFAEHLRPDLPEPDGFRSAVRWMRHSVFLKSAAYQAKKWAAERAGGDPGLLAWIDAVVRKFEVLGVPVWPRTIVVSEADQNRLFVLGLSIIGLGRVPIITAMRWSWFTACLAVICRLNAGGRSRTSASRWRRRSILKSSGAAISMLGLGLPSPGCGWSPVLA